MDVQPLDLLLTGGHVLDPANGIDKPVDVGGNVLNCTGNEPNGGTCSIAGFDCD